MNDDIEKFGYDSMQQRTIKRKIMKSTSLRAFKVKFCILYLYCKCVCILQKLALSLAKCMFTA